MAEQNIFDVYTLDDIINDLDKNDPTSRAIAAYMEKYPAGFGTNERDHSELGYSVTPITAKINGTERIVLLRDVFEPKELNDLILAQEQVSKAQGSAQEINSSVYDKNAKEKPAVATNNEEQKSLWERFKNRVKNMVRRNHEDNETQRLIIQNQYKNLFRETGADRGINVLASKVVEANYRLRQIRHKVREDARDVRAETGKKINSAEEKKYRQYMLYIKTGRLDKLKKFSDEEIKRFEEMEKSKKPKMAPVKQTTIDPKVVRALAEKEKSRQEDPYRSHYVNPNGGDNSSSS